MVIRFGPGLRRLRVTFGWTRRLRAARPRYRLGLPGVGEADVVG
jgi:hypothetical protein